MHNLKGLMGHKFLFVTLFAVFGLALGCSIIEPRPVEQKGIEDVHPKAIIEKEKKVKPPGPPPFQKS